MALGGFIEIRIFRVWIEEGERMGIVDEDNELLSGTAVLLET